MAFQPPPPPYAAGGFQQGPWFVPKMTDEAAIAQVKQLFQFLDFEKTNWVKIENINRLWKSLGCKKIDKPDDYEIEFLEFLGIFIQISSDIFNEYDVDEKGFLTPPDLVKLGDKYLDEKIDMNFFQGADMDGNYEISFGEFLSHMAKMCQYIRPRSRSSSSSSSD